MRVLGRIFNLRFQLGNFQVEDFGLPFEAASQIFELLQLRLVCLLHHPNLLVNYFEHFVLAVNTVCLDLQSLQAQVLNLADNLGGDLRVHRRQKLVLVFDKIHVLVDFLESFLDVFQ